MAVTSTLPAHAAPLNSDDVVDGQAHTAPTIEQEDPRYPSLTRGQNQRWVSTPDRIYLPKTTDAVVAAVANAVADRLPLSVRSGGHCYENFVDRPEVGAIVDMTHMDTIRWDDSLKAVQVEAGATLGDVYYTLFKRWGTTLPGGSCYPVGAGGHVLGAGYGPLSRRHGLISDHLYAVEVVVVDAGGKAQAVVATREPEDPNRDLLWAHTGAGGGSFGIVTRYWFRSRGGGPRPNTALPLPPSEVWIHRSEWSWTDMSRERFSRLMRNYGTWMERHSSADGNYAGLFSRLELTTRPTGAFHLVVQMDADRPEAERLLTDFLNAVNEGVGVEPTITDHRRLPWLHASGWPGMWMSNPTDRYKYKSSFHRRGFTDTQIAAFYERLTNTDYTQPPFVVSIASYGAQVNALSADDTAHSHRDSVMLLLWGTAWQNKTEDDRHLSWHREFYRSVYADTGGVPVPNADTDGCFINYCDIDLNNESLNASGVPWHDLYYKDNYTQLRKVKKRWDPLNVFHHAQSVRLP